MKNNSKKIRICIVGDGFAGLQAVRTLAIYRKKVPIDVTLIGRGSSVFLPLLPDVLSGNISNESIVYDYTKELKKYKFRCITSLVKRIDHDKKNIVLEDEKSLAFDYCIVTAGSRRAFTIPGTEAIIDDISVMKVKSIIEHAISENKRAHFVVVGGGYTGVETISSIWKLCTMKKYTDGIFTLVELSDNILSGLPDFIRKNIIKQLDKAGIIVYTKTGLIFKNNSFSLNGRKLSLDLIVISAGVRGASDAMLSDFAEPKTGRLEVNVNLKVVDSIYAAGDAAFFKEKSGRPLRQSVNFAIYQGKLAAKNIIREIRGRKPKKYLPFDPGYIVPTVISSKGWGKALGISVGGKLGMLLHYLICIYRSQSTSKRWQLFRELIFSKK